jgi:chitinase
VRRAALLPALVAACYDPSYPQHLACSLTFSCPPGQVCGPESICEPAAPAGTPDGGGASPTGLFAVAGADQTVPVGAVVGLTSSGSYDLQSRPLSFRWTFASRPAGSSASIDAAASAAASFEADVAGVYPVDLQVTAGSDVASDRVVITAQSAPVFIDVGPNVVTYTGTRVTLAAQVTGGHGALVHAWTLTRRPASSVAAVLGADTLTATLVPDVDGDYALQLRVTDQGMDYSAEVTVTTYHPIAALGHRVVDAEISRPLGRIVMVDRGPDALYAYDPTSGAETMVPLPLPPTSVSVSPDGKLAAVGHDAYVSEVSLVDGALVKVCPMPIVVDNVALAGNGYVYVVAADTAGSLHSLALATCADATTQAYIYPHAEARLHPGGDRLYVLDDANGFDSLKDFDITGGVAVALPSAYDDHSRCGGLWITEDGGRILTGCGNTFHASATATDMTYAGAVPGTTLIASADHTIAAGKIVLVPSAYVISGEPVEDEVVHIHDPAFLTLEREVALTRFVAGGTAYAGHGKFVFIDPDGARYHVILRADPAAAPAAEFAVATYPL